MADLLQPGDLAVVRSIWRGAVWSAHPTRVLEHTNRHVALWMQPGAVWKRPVWPDGTRARVPSDEPWHLADEAWRPPGVIRLTEFGAPFSVLGFFNETGDDIAAWYVNLEAPVTRSRFGFDTLDHMLDLWVAPDFTSHRWKDEDEIAEAVRRGSISSDTASGIRAAGERAVELLANGLHIANGDWRRWHRDPAWPAAVLPGDWEQIG